MLYINGNMVKLPDGRIFQKSKNGAWQDTRTGIEMNEIQLTNLMYSNVFYGVPDDGRNTRGTVPATFKTGYIWVGSIEN